MTFHDFSSLTQPGSHHMLSISCSFCIFLHMGLPNIPTLLNGQTPSLPLSLSFLFYRGIPSSLSPPRTSPHLPTSLQNKIPSIPPSRPPKADLSTPALNAPRPPVWPSPLISPSPFCLFHLPSSLMLISSFTGKPSLDSDHCQFLSLPGSLTIKLKDSIFLPPLTLNLWFLSFISLECFLL